MPTIDDLGGAADWLVRAGCVWRSDFTAEVDCTPIDLTGVTVNAVVTPSATDDTVLKTFTVTMTNPTGGEFSIQIDEPDADLDPGRYWWLAQWDLGDGNEPIVSGPFVVQPWVISP
jgi:hypothetical protein